MLDKILTALSFAYRQKVAVFRFLNILTGKAFSFKKIAALITAFVEMFTVAIFDGGMTPLGQELNLDGYSLVFCDDFNGTSLDTENWDYRASGPRRFGFNSENQVSVSGGNLTIKGEYREDGEYGPGWYVGMINLKKQYCRGYFEIRCICNSGKDFWSAFWLQGSNPYDHEKSNGGIGSVEIDIFESMGTEVSNIFKRNCIYTTVHCNGGDDDVENIDSLTIGKFKGNNIYKEFNTYGLEWTEDEYIFYLNGVETGRTSFSKGVCQNEEMVIVSLEVPSNVSYEPNSGHETEFIVDYVKIWQK